MLFICLDIVQRRIKLVIGHIFQIQCGENTALSIDGRDFYLSLMCDAFFFGQFFIDVNIGVIKKHLLHGGGILWCVFVCAIAPRCHGLCSGYRERHLMWEQDWPWVPRR